MAMTDFKELLIALGRGIVKILISALVGFGVGLLLIGITTAGKPHIWETRGVPGELLIGIGSGLLAGGVMLLALFLIPWMMKRTPPTSIFVDEPLVPARAAPGREPVSPPLAMPPRVEHERSDDFYAK
jgi:hypothetical protein